MRQIIKLTILLISIYSVTSFDCSAVNGNFYDMTFRTVKKYSATNVCWYDGSGKGVISVTSMDWSMTIDGSGKLDSSVSKG